MEIGKTQGKGLVMFGLILLTAGILVLVSVPSWGNWISSYPGTLSPGAFPPEAAPVVQVMGGVFGPLLEQVGGYIQKVGYFIGSLLTIVSIGVTAAGTMVIRTAKS